MVTRTHWMGIVSSKPIPMGPKCGNRYDTCKKDNIFLGIHENAHYRAWRKDEDQRALNPNSKVMQEVQTLFIHSFI